jgi:hypothetical protein
MHFSLIPPTGKTRPWSEISPVIAKSFLTLLFVKRETKAVVIQTPALGPSFGIEAAGKWTWISNYLNINSDLLSSLWWVWGSSSSWTLKVLKDLRIPILLAFDLIQLNAVFTDSFITSPSFPVKFIIPVPGYFAVSISNALPPASV